MREPRPNLLWPGEIIYLVRARAPCLSSAFLNWNACLDIDIDALFTHEELRSRSMLKRSRKILAGYHWSELTVKPCYLKPPDISNVSLSGTGGCVPGSGLVSVYRCNSTLDISNPGISTLDRVPGGGLVSVYHSNFTLDISILDRVPGRGFVSVYHCNFTLDISNPGISTLDRVPGGGLVSVYHSNFTLDISILDRVPGRGLVSVYHSNFTLGISNPRYLNLRPRPRTRTCVSVSL